MLVVKYEVEDGRVKGIKRQGGGRTYTILSLLYITSSTIRLCFRYLPNHIVLTRGVNIIRLSIIHPIHLKIYPSDSSISKKVG
ncbi:hypothetical protein QL285_096278 [Trifolium repens]|nr:hypothetical protein QL285_096278 [Trifolium repens]